jgi:hypothetical protein
MATKKASSAAETPATDTQTPAVTNQDDTADIVSDAVDTPAIAEVDPVPAAIPDPIVALNEHGNERPLSGGSFIRQADGTLTRNMEA